MPSLCVTDAEVSMQRSNVIRKFTRTQEFSLVVLLIVMILVFSFVTNGDYLGMENLTSILNVMVIATFLTIGEAMLILYGVIDLSPGYVGTMCAFIMSIIITTAGLPWWLGILGACAAGALCGLLCAVMVNQLNFQPFIATLAMYNIAQGLTYVIPGSTGGTNIYVSDPVIDWLSETKAGIIPVTVFIALAALIIYGVILSKTKFGRSIYLCGGNRAAARLAGIKPKKISYILFINMGFLAAFAGCMYVVRLKNAQVTGITMSNFTGITAAILGGVAFGGGSGTMLGCFLGLLVLNSFNNGLTFLGVNTYLRTMFSGLILIIALIFDFINKRIRTTGGYRAR